MEAHEQILCRGHPLVRGTHPTTFEVTVEEDLTLQGDCIIGVGADKGAVDLDPAFRRILARDDARLITVLRAGGLCVEVRGRGSRDLALTHPTDLVWRRSRFTCGRTIAIASDHTARQLPRELIACLAKGAALRIDLTAVIPGGTAR
jgi:hypothetical protein